MTNAMNVKPHGGQSMKCEACDDTGWVCETHEARPCNCGDNTSKRAGARATLGSA